MRPLTILCLVLLSSCSLDVPIDKLVERNGITYYINSNTPFTGSSVSYFENGQLEIKGNYKDGKRDGLWEGFHDNGQLKNRENYKDGKPTSLNGLREYFDRNGNREYFDRNGNSSIPQTFRNGVEV